MNIRSIELKHNDKRAQIIEAAIELFVSKGFQQTSMALISKESGIAIGTIYHYFSGKDQLIQETYIYVTEKFGRAVAFEPEEMELDLRERFDLLWIKSYHFFVDHPNYFYFKDSLNYSPLISKELRDESRRYYQIAFDLIKEGIEKGVFTKSHPVGLGSWIYNTILTPAQMKLRGEMEINHQTLKEFMAMTWKGLTTN